MTEKLLRPRSQTRAEEKSSGVEIGSARDCESAYLIESLNIYKNTVDIKVTVQFKTEGNGQNEIFSHMDRSEVKL